MAIRIPKRFEKPLTNLEHVDFIATWLGKLCVILFGSGLGTLMTFIVSKIVELSGNWKIGIWLIFSAIAIWASWKIALILVSKREIAKKMIIYLPILIGIAFCVWAYIVGVRVFQISDDVRHLRAQVTRFVLPRELSLQQISTIAEYLSKQQPQNVRMKVISRDEEASSYRSDLQTALEKGGWTVNGIDYSDDVSEGMSIEVKRPNNQTANPAEILAAALEQAGVVIQGRSSGVGANLTSTVVTILVGRRRRDRGAVTTPGFIERHREQPTPRPTDDDY